LKFYSYLKVPFLNTSGISFSQSESQLFEKLFEKTIMKIFKKKYLDPKMTSSWWKIYAQRDYLHIFNFFYKKKTKSIYFDLLLWELIFYFISITMRKQIDFINLTIKEDIDFTFSIISYRNRFSKPSFKCSNWINIKLKTK
jgi:hypothetical protein